MKKLFILLSVLSFSSTIAFGSYKDVNRLEWQKYRDVERKEKRKKILEDSSLSKEEKDKLKKIWEQQDKKRKQRRINAEKRRYYNRNY